MIIHTDSRGQIQGIQDRIDKDINNPDGGGNFTAPTSYYAKVRLTFMRDTMPAKGVTFNGSYTSYYSDGSSATFTIDRTTLGAKENKATITLVSFRKNVTGAVTINARASGGTVTTTVTIPFTYTSKNTPEEVTERETTKETIQLMDGDIKLPSIYKPFFFNATLKFNEQNNVLDSNMMFYCAIANATPYRLTNGKYIIGTPTLMIDNRKFYFYNNENSIKSITVSDKEEEGRYFYVGDNASSLTKNYEVQFNCSIGRIDIDPKLPHNYTFSVTEGSPVGYNGSLDVITAEDSLYGVKFYDNISNVPTGGNSFYPCGDGIALGGIRHFFVNSTEAAMFDQKSLPSISAINYYETDPMSWKSIHTYVTEDKGIKYNLYDREVKPEMIMESGANYGKYHFNFTDSSRNYYVGLTDRYTALDGNTISNEESDYGIETTESPYKLYTKVPRHTSVLSVLYVKNI